MRIGYAMSGSNVGVLATRCPVLTYRMLLPARPPTGGGGGGGRGGGGGGGGGQKKAEEEKKKGREGTKPVGAPSSTTTPPQGWHDATQCPVLTERMVIQRRSYSTWTRHSSEKPLKSLQPRNRRPRHVMCAYWHSVCERADIYAGSPLLPLSPPPSLPSSLSPLLPPPSLPSSFLSLSPPRSLSPPPTLSPPPPADSLSLGAGWAYPAMTALRRCSAHALLSST
eukprot:2511021-Rhodomonas_salina.6